MRAFKSALGTVLGLVVAGTTFVQIASAAQIDFESVPVGTKYGTGFGHVPGSVVLTQDGIQMSVENFHSGGSTLFFRAEVGGVYDAAFPTTPLSMDNINAKFDFSNVGFPVSSVSVEYFDDGGANNISVNGEPILEIPAFGLDSIPVNIALGVTATADGDSITLNGTIQSLLIGGQELAIDNIVAVPEPTALILLASGGLALIARRRTK